MLNLIDWFKGKKTYILAVLLALYDVLLVFNVLEHTLEQKALVVVFMMALMGMSIRAGMKKSTVVVD